MNSYTLDLISLSPGSEGGLFGNYGGYAIFGIKDGVNFSMSSAEWIEMGRPIRVSIVVQTLHGGTVEVDA